MATDYSVSTSQQEEAEISDDEFDTMDEPSSANTLSSISSTAFDAQLLLAETNFPFYNSANSNDFYMQQDMHYHLDLASQQSLNTSMRAQTSSFEGFPQSSSTSQLAFDNSPISMPMPMLGLDPSVPFHFS